MVSNLTKCYHHATVYYFHALTPNLISLSYFVTDLQSLLLSSDTTEWLLFLSAPESQQPTPSVHLLKDPDHIIYLTKGCVLASPWLFTTVTLLYCSCCSHTSFLKFSPHLLLLSVHLLN